MKRYLYAISLLCGLIFCGCNEDFTYYTLSVEGTTSVATISSATIDADIVYRDQKGQVRTYVEYEPNVPTIESYGVYYSPSNTKPGKNDLRVEIENNHNYSGTYEKLDHVTVTLNGLKSNTAYYARAFVRNQYGEVTGDVIEIVTNGTASVTTKSATDITYNSATLNGSISAGSGTVNLQKRGFVLSTSSTPTIESNTKKWEQSSSATGNFSTTMTGLSANTKYYYRAYAVMDGNVVYGSTTLFTTKTKDDAISIVTNDPTNVTSTSATVSGTINIGTDAKGTITEIGIMYLPTTEVTFGKLKTWTGSTISSWTGSHTFTATLNFGSYDSYYYYAYYIKGGETYGTTSKIVTRSGGGGGGGGGTALSIADFKSKPDDPDTWYILTGVIYYIDNTTYGNFYLADETGLLPVYGLTSTKRTSNDKSFSSLGLQEGDYITISAPKSTYDGNAQAKCGYLVEKKEPLTSSSSFDTYKLEPTTTSTIQLPDPDDIYVYPVTTDESQSYTYTYTYCHLFLYFGQNSLYAEVNFFGEQDPVIVIPAGTYDVKNTMMGSVWGTNGTQESSGYLAYLNHDTPSRYISENSSYFGYRCPYYITGGSLKVTKSGTKANLDINLTTYFGSTIKGNFTVDLLGNVSNAPSAVVKKEQKMILQRQAR